MGALKPCYNIFCYRRLSAETKLGLFVIMSGIEWQVGGSMRQRVEQIACPACGKYQSMDIFETVNTAVDPTVRDRILRRELFLYRCASCGHEMAVSYDCVYKDIGYRFIVYLVPPQTPNAIELIQSAQRQCTELLGKLKETFCLRVVSNLSELEEKILLLEKGRDDRIIEIYKTVLLRNYTAEREDYTVKKAFFGLSEGQERFYFTDERDHCTSVDFEESVYRQLYGMFINQIAPLYDNYFSVVNLKWAYRLLEAQNSESHH